jgi:hypothetical protein
LAFAIPLSRYDWRLQGSQLDWEPVYREPARGYVPAPHCAGLPMFLRHIADMSPMKARLKFSRRRCRNRVSPRVSLSAPIEARH